MSIEAMWTVRFGSSQATEDQLNGGVAVFESGRVMGGDSAYAYLGNIEVVAHTVKGRLLIKRHDPAGESMYGRDEDQFEVSFTGRRVNNDRIEGSLHRPGFPSARLLLRRFAELP